MWPSFLATDHFPYGTRIRVRTPFKSASLFDGLAIDDGRAEAADGVGVVAGELEPVDQEEAPEPRRLAGRGADLVPEDVESQGGGRRSRPRAHHLEVALPLDLEEADRDPDRVLVSPHRGQV